MTTVSAKVLGLIATIKTVIAAGATKTILAEREREVLKIMAIAEKRVHLKSVSEGPLRGSLPRLLPLLLPRPVLVGGMGW